MKVPTTCRTLVLVGAVAPTMHSHPTLYEVSNSAQTSCGKSGSSTCCETNVTTCCCMSSFMSVFLITTVGPKLSLTTQSEVVSANDASNIFQYNIQILPRHTYFVLDSLAMIGTRLHFPITSKC